MVNYYGLETIALAIIIDTKLSEILNFRRSYPRIITK